MKFISLLTQSLLFILVSIAATAYSQSDKPAYQLFNAKGVPVSYQSMVDTLVKAQVVFFGELHNNAISHWLQLEVAMDLHQNDSQRLVMGAEMFERDDQLILNEYLTGIIRERDFEASATLWNNYKTDYKPLINYAFQHKIPFVATNIPRRYAALVNRFGFEALDSLSWEAKSMIAPLPVPYDPTLPGYKAMSEMGGPAMHANANLPKAQAIKDATMAWFIAENLNDTNTRFLHFNGSYHSDNHEGIVWYLNRYRPGVKIITIATVVQEDVALLENSGLDKADFVLVVNSRVTQTY